MLSLSKEESLSPPVSTRPAPPVIIRLEAVSKTYPGQRQDGEAAHPAVQNVTLDLHQGELLALLGPSGCGKTTTLRLIAGFEQPDAGRTLINGQVVAGTGRWQPPEKRRLGMVFQDYALFPHLTVRQNIEFGLRQTGRSERARRSAELLRLIGLAELASRYPHELSGGQQQRVAIARALAPRPLALLLDEAFNSLDAAVRATLRREVRDILKAEGVTAVLVTHDQDEAFVVADRMAVMRQGRLEQVGPPEEIFRQPLTRFVAGFVGRANFLPARLERGRLISEMGLLPAPPHLETSDSLLAGRTEVELLLRPQEIELLPHYSEAGASATVLSRVYCGPDSLYTVRLPNGQELEAVSAADFQPGQEVKLKAHPRTINIY